MTLCMMILTPVMSQHMLYLLVLNIYEYSVLTENLYTELNVCVSIYQIILLKLLFVSSTFLYIVYFVQ